jgi:DNA-binding phage protein
MPSPSDTLYGAWLAASRTGLTLDALVDRSSLAVSRYQLSRKLRGTSPWRLDEFLAVARALGVSVVARRRAR